jgi:hypothetical protein
MGIWGASERWKAPGETYFLFEVEPTTVTPEASTGILEGDPNDGVTLRFTRRLHATCSCGAHISTWPGKSSRPRCALSTADPVTAAIATLDYSAATFQTGETLARITVILRAQ